MVKQIYNARNGRNGRNGRVTALSREAHRKNPYSALFRYCEEDDIEEEVNKDDEDSETEPTSTKKTAVVPKVVGRKPKAASKANTNKRQRRQVSTDDDDISYLDEQIKNNKTSTTGATTKVSTPKKGKAKGKGSVSKKSSASAKKPANSAKKSHKNAAENEVDDEIDFDDLHKTKEGERISSANHHTSSSKNTEINELKSRISAMDIRNQKLEDLLERRENQLAHQTSKNSILNKKLELANQYIDKSNLDDGQHTMEINERHLSTGKKKCVKAFRIVKFLNNEAGLYQFGDMIMDMMGDPNLTRSIRDSDEDKRITEDNRNIYRRTYQNFWRKCINNHRTEVQNELRKYVLDYMEEQKWTKLPHPDLLDNLIVRDFSQFDHEEDDDEETKANKTKDLKDAQGFFDFYVDKMVPTVAGKKVWHPHARHHELMSTSLLPNKQPRVPPNTESLVAVMYRNCYQKWNQMHAWDLTTQGPYPQFKKPDINPEWATEYTDACGGQQRWGGWSIAGRVKFVKLAKIVQVSRKKNAKRHLQVEKACLRRLQAKYKDLYANKSNRNTAKKRKASEVTREEEELLQLFIVDEDEDAEQQVQNADEDDEENSDDEDSDDNDDNDFD